MCIRCGKILRNTVRVNSSYFHYSQNLNIIFLIFQLEFYIMISPY